MKCRGASLPPVLYKQTNQPCFRLEKTELHFHAIVAQASTANCFDTGSVNPDGRGVYNVPRESLSVFLIISSTDFKPMRSLDMLKKIKTIGRTQYEIAELNHAAMSSPLQNEAGEFISQKGARPGVF